VHNAPDPGMVTPGKWENLFTFETHSASTWESKQVKRGLRNCTHRGGLHLFYIHIKSLLLLSNDLFSQGNGGEKAVRAI
jgi:hypothetical protein